MQHRGQNMRTTSLLSGAVLTPVEHGRLLEHVKGVYPGCLDLLTVHNPDNGYTVHILGKGGILLDKLSANTLGEIVDTLDERPVLKPTKWAMRFLEMARAVGSWSKDTTKVGALLVDGKSVLLTAFNGPAQGVEDKPERFSRENGEKYLWAEHAEQNLITLAARHGLSTAGKTVVCTHFCCSRCAGILVQAGIKEVILGNGTTSMPAREFEFAKAKFAEAGVEAHTFPGHPY